MALPSQTKCRGLLARNDAPIKASSAVPPREADLGAETSACGFFGVLLKPNADRMDFVPPKPLPEQFFADLGIQCNDSMRLPCASYTSMLPNNAACASSSARSP